MGRERMGNGRPRNGRKGGAAGPSGGPATAPPDSPDTAEAPAPVETDAAEARRADPPAPFPADAPPDAPAPLPPPPDAPVEDFKFLSSFQQGRGGGGSAAEPLAGEPAPLAAPAEPAPPVDAEPVPSAVPFPTEAAWNASGGEVEEAGSDLLCFTIANEEFAIDIQRVWEIIRPRNVTEIPGVPEFISGIIALRGEIVPVLDLRTRLGFPPAGTAQATAKIIVAVHDGRRIGMAVDAVSHKIHVRDEQIAQPNALLGGQESGFLTGVCRHQGRLIAILNADVVLAFRTGAEGVPAGMSSGVPGEGRAQGGSR